MAIDIDAIIAQLWPHGDLLNGTQIHMLADGARDDRLGSLIRFGKLDSTCLFGEPLTPRLRAAAPFLVHLAAGSAQTRDMLARAADHGGILLATPAGISTEHLRRHFKKLLWVEDEAGRKLYFRFYDPRVLRVYLPTCTLEEKAIFFGPVEHYHCVDEKGLTTVRR